MLVDTGSAVTVVRADLWESITGGHPIELKPPEQPVVVADGKPLEQLGQISVLIQVGSVCTQQKAASTSAGMDSDIGGLEPGASKVCTAVISTGWKLPTFSDWCTVIGVVVGLSNLAMVHPFLLVEIDRATSKLCR